MAPLRTSTEPNSDSDLSNHETTITVLLVRRSVGVTNAPAPSSGEDEAAAAEAEGGVEATTAADQTVQLSTGVNEEAADDQDDQETPAEGDEETEREPPPAPATAGQGDGRQLRPRDRLTPPNRFLNQI
ncbi:hypothetical protein SASPL_114517 [Salvia splendens]|uniref:Uncharacterized protein n=1 Tax=Salvia splendens TaxID=180675 RepID=A0A8X8Y226_SALSN|nr:hypothetical protein SASPL_114517 [Salvia splendens]